MAPWPTVEPLTVIGQSFENKSHQSLKKHVQTMRHSPQDEIPNLIRSIIGSRFSRRFLADGVEPPTKNISFYYVSTWNVPQPKTTLSSSEWSKNPSTPIAQKSKPSATQLEKQKQSSASVYPRSPTPAQHVCTIQTYSSTTMGRSSSITGNLCRHSLRN